MYYDFPQLFKQNGQNRCLLKTSVHGKNTMSAKLNDKLLRIFKDNLRISFQKAYERLRTMDDHRLLPQPMIYPSLAMVTSFFELVNL